jgi:hypothetical protein
MEFNVGLYRTLRLYIMACLLKERTVEAEKQPLQGNGPYTRGREKHHVRCDVT